MLKIRDLSINDTTTITLVVKSATARETRAKKPYLAIEFYDGQDTINGNYWDWTSGKIPEINSILDVTAQVTEWQGVKQLNVKSMKLNATEVLASFLPTASYDVGEYYKHAYALASEIKDDTLRAITVSIFEELQSLWLDIPGAKGVHHAFVGGTLVHSFNVAWLACVLAGNIPEANRDLCIAGGLLHDVGKLYTYKVEGISIDLTDEGKLFDHIFIGAEFVGNFAEAHVNCDDPSVARKVRLLRHIILSHHGCLEYGSPVTPQCIEAYIVNHADGLDAQVEQIRMAASKTPGKWTDRIFTLSNRPQLTPAYVEWVMSGSEEEPTST